MTDTDQKREDAVLRRMLKTKPKPHEPLKEAERRKKIESKQRKP